MIHILYKINISKILSNLFYFIFIIFSVFGIFIKSFNTLISLSKDNYYSKISIVLIALLFLLIFIIVINKINKEVTYNEITLIYPSILFIFSLIIRLIIVLLMGFDTNQVSDFMNAYSFSMIDPPLNEEWYQIFSNWGFYVSYLHGLNKLFGMSPITGIIFNSIINSISVVLIYFICNLTFKKVEISIIAAIFYMLWPMQLFYNILLTPEIVHIFLALLSVLLFLIGHTKYKKAQNFYGLIFYCIGGISLGLAGLFKPIDKIMVIALIIVIILLYLENTYKDKTISKKIEKRTIRDMLQKQFWGLFIGIVISCITFQIGFLYLDSYVGKTVNRNTMPNYLYIGLNHKSGGLWSQEVAVYKDIVLKHNYNFKQANNEVMELLRDDIINNKHLTLRFFDQKIKYAWSDNLYYQFIDDTINNGDITAINKTYWLNFIAVSSQSYWVIITLLMCIGMINELFSRDGIKKIILFSSLLIFGFALMLLVTEVQSRYKCVIYPYIAIIAALGCYRICNLGKKILRVIIH